MKYKQKLYILIIICFLILSFIFFQSNTDAMMYKIYTLPELIQESLYIVYGTINIEEDYPVINIQEAIKGNIKGRYKVNLTPIPFKEPPVLHENEQVLLFISQVVEDAIHLTGMGDQGKWPKDKAHCDNCDNVYSDANIQDIIEIIPNIMIIQNTDDFNMQIKKLNKMLTSSNNLLQMASLQLIDSFYYSPSKEKQRISKLLSISAIHLLSSNEFIIRFETLKVLERLPDSLLIEHLIQRLTDTNFGIRRKAFDMLNSRITAIADNEKPSYDPNWSIDRLDEGKERFMYLWKHRRDNALKKEIPRLIKELDSEDWAVRHYSVGCLRLISNENFKYNPDDPQDMRKLSIDKWRQWWKEYKGQNKEKQ